MRVTNGIHLTGLRCKLHPNTEGMDRNNGCEQLPTNERVGVLECGKAHTGTVRWSG